MRIRSTSLVAGLAVVATALATPLHAQGARAHAGARPIASRASAARTEAALAARFRTALTYEAFTASDTSRRALWTANHARAAAPVADVIARVRRLPGRWHLLVVAESWCSDAANSVPYLARLAAEAGNVEVRLLRKADAADLLASHPLAGRAATPLVLILDERFVERGAWIEQPAPLRQMVARKTGRICESTLDAQVASWYRKDGGRAMLGEVAALLERAATTRTSAARR